MDNRFKVMFYFIEYFLFCLINFIIKFILYIFKVIISSTNNKGWNIR